MKNGVVQIGLIGVSHRASIAQHFDADDRAQVVAGADINPGFLEKFQEQYAHNKPYVTEDYHDLLKRDDLDVIAVFTPDNRHYQPTMDALAAGKHVFCEKPMAICIDHCDAMLQAAQDAGRHLMVGMNMRYNDNVLTLKRVIDEGQIGQVKAVWVRHMVGAGGFFYFHDYRASREGSTSLLLQKGSHDIDVIHYLTGRYTQRVIAMGNRDYFGGQMPNDLHCENCDYKNTCPEFSSRGLDERGENDPLSKTKCAFRQEVDVEDHNMVMMEMGDIRAAYLQCMYAARHDRNYLLIGTEGQVELTGDTVTLTTWKANRTKANIRTPFAEATYDVGQRTGGHGGADPVMCTDFLDMICDGKTPTSSAQAGRMAVAVGCEAAASLRNGSQPREIPAINSPSPAGPAGK